MRLFVFNSATAIRSGHGNLVVCNFEKSIIFAVTIAGIAQLVEHDLAKVGAASSSLVSRSAIKKAPHAGRLFFDCAATLTGAVYMN